MPKTDGNTSEMLSTTPPCPPSAKRPASQLIGSKPTEKKWYQSSRPREMPWQHTNPTSVIRTSRFSVLFAAKSSSMPGNASVTVGFSSAPRFRSQLTPANIKAMYDGIKLALGPKQKKTAPLKSATGEMIQDREQQMERWVEHYTELYARENVITEDTLNAIECLPELEELDELDREPTTDELSEALDSLTSGKAPGKDCIPAEVLKSCKETLITELHEILCLCMSKAKYHKTWGMLMSPHCTKTMATEAIAIVIAAYPSSLSLGKSLHA